MKINWSQIGLIALVSGVVVYASNNEIPVFGKTIRDTMNGGRGWL